MHLGGCSTIDFFHTWVKRLDWRFFIKNIKQSYLGITRVHSIQDKTSTCTNIAKATVLRVKKENWANLENQPLKPN